MKTDGSCHEQVVVRTYDGTIRTIRLLLVVDVLVETTLVSLDVHILTDNPYQGCYNHRLCRYVCMESVFLRSLLLYILCTLLACVEVLVHTSYLVEDKSGLVSLGVSLLVVRLERV